MHRRVALTATCLTLAGAGGAIALSASASGSAPPATSHVGVESVGCEGISATGHRPHGSCTYVLSDGRRFKCPLSFSRQRQTAAALERAKACRPLRPIRIPASWKPVFTRLYAVQACLARHHVTARGGPMLEGPRPRRTPIGELITFTTKPTAFIGFYTTAGVARRAEPQVLENARRFGGRVERRGAVTIVWTKPPPAALRAITDACAFA